MDEIEDAVDRFFLHNPADGITGPNYDAVETIDELTRSDPDAAWPVIEMLIERAPTEEALAYLAAGPLENLLRKHGRVVATKIRAAAEQNAGVRAALSHVWLLPSNDEVHQQLGEWLPTE